MKGQMGYLLEIGEGRGKEVEGTRFSGCKKNESGIRNLYTEQF